MNKEELCQKLGCIYGGQKELIDDVLNAFDNLEHLNKMLQWSKDRLNKSEYELQQENNQLKQENQELINILKIIRKDINFVELCDGYIIENKLNELEGEIYEN